MRFYAIVPAKEHSERVPNKNIRNFNGKPLFYWIINTLKKIEDIEKIILDTDSDKISDFVLKFFPDITINFRPEHLHGDFVSMNKIIENILINYNDTNFFIQTHVTNPCLKKETIEKAIEIFKIQNDYDSLFTVTKIQARLYDKDFNPLNHDPDELIRTQDLPQVYEENSCLYIFSRNSFFKNKSRIGRNPYLFEINKLEAIDIDTEEDFILAEKIHEIL